MSRCVFVFCDALEKGFVTRLSPEQRIDLIYSTPLVCDQFRICLAEQIDEVLLTGTDYELVSVELSEKVLPGRWILPPFLRLKDPDLHFEAALYAKAIIRKKAIDESLSAPDPLTSPGLETPEQTEIKDGTADEDTLPEAPEKTKPPLGKKAPMSPQKIAPTKRRSKANSPEIDTKKTKTISTHKTRKTMEKVHQLKDKKTERTPQENVSDSQETAGTQDLESPSSSNT